MTLFERIFGKKEGSANKAKDRLKLMLACERAECSVPYLDDLKKDMLKVIQKYTKVGDINIRAENNQNVDMLEVEIFLSK
jgi:cell division topological specificity factor